MFYSLDDARIRLRATLLRTKTGKPIYVRDVSFKKHPFDYYLHVIYLSNRAEDILPLKDIDLLPVPLGNVNINEIALFVSRTPSRIWKQGLSNENMNYTCFLFTGLPKLDIFNRCLMAPITNKYPSIYDCYINMSKYKSHSQAFSRQFSLYKNINIIYRCREAVGTIDEGSISKNNNTVKFKLFENFAYLNEVLTESINDPA